MDLENKESNSLFDFLGDKCVLNHNCSLYQSLSLSYLEMLAWDYINQSDRSVQFRGRILHTGEYYFINKPVIILHVSNNSVCEKTGNRNFNHFHRAKGKIYVKNFFIEKILVAGNFDLTRQLFVVICLQFYAMPKHYYFHFFFVFFLFLIFIGLSIIA